ncbi:hypothetical protein GJ496_007757 [Pomphorhynchus laevis]|nr:hypothetical protein GJ496_007757 [Pomphorhynchus laevis]
MALNSEDFLEASIAMTFIGQIVSYEWCKKECDSVRRCVAFSFHGTRAIHGHCALASMFSHFQDTSFYDTYVKRRCLVDENIQRNMPEGETTPQPIIFNTITIPVTICIPQSPKFGNDYYNMESPIMCFPRN